MPLQIGEQLSSYEITSVLGKGGMGEVYRARDTKLKRDVAIKVLPNEFSRHGDRVSRFQREAEVLASLNHPNIAAIYDLQKAGETPFLVLELVEGATLAERVQRGRLPIDEVLHIARGICEALEAAHEKTIIHRDLKPSNVKITPEGKVKLLDFGLARIFEEPSNTDVSNSPTLMSNVSGGIILGTAAYMSPEQARGEQVDRRADIWAFGCVLYEMLTGRPAFSGETVTDILARVVTLDPDWTALPAYTPRGIRQVLKRCLRKDRKQRLHDICDARIEIEEAGMDAEASVASESTRGAWLAWTVAVVAVLVAAVLGAIHLREPGPPSPPEIRVEINTPATREPHHFAISSDGRQFVFVASGDGAQRLWLRPLDAATARPLAGTEGAEYPFWSPDSHSIGFFASGKLKRVDIGGGPPQSVTDAPTGRGGTWNRDGTILFAPTNEGPLWRVSAVGGQPVQVTKLDSPRQASHRFPQFLQDGRHFLFFSQGNVEGQGIQLGSLDAGETQRLTPADTAGAYMEPGLLLFNQQGVLVARRLDVTHAALTGDPVTLADSVGYDSTFNLGGFSVSPGGDVAYRAGGLERRQLTWFDRTGKTVSVVAEPVNTSFNCELSPDGRRVAVYRNIQSNTDVWLIDVLRSTAQRATFDAAVDSQPVWSPDSTRIAFASNRKGTYNLYIKSTSGASADELLLESPHINLPMHWSPDGRLLLYTDSDPKTGWDLWALPITGDHKPVPVANTPFEERGGQFSPDGHWVAYQSNETGQFEIYVQPFPGPGYRSQVSRAGGTDPRWRHDGKELFFMSPDAKVMAATVQASGATFEAAVPVVLFQTRVATGGNFNLKQQYDVSRDGRFLINQTVEESTTTPITLILNWNHGSKKK
jgi:Tol biopolymer transport system component/predicted Ser/Thr protein kinase